MESPGASWGVDRLTGRLYWHYRHSTGDDDDDDDDDDALGGSGPLWSTSVDPWTHCIHPEPPFLPT